MEFRLCFVVDQWWCVGHGGCIFADQWGALWQPGAGHSPPRMTSPVQSFTAAPSLLKTWQNVAISRCYSSNFSAYIDRATENPVMARLLSVSAIWYRGSSDYSNISLRNTYRKISENTQNNTMRSDDRRKWHTRSHWCVDILTDTLVFKWCKIMNVRKFNVYATSQTIPQISPYSGKFSRIRRLQKILHRKPLRVFSLFLDFSLYICGITLVYLWYKDCDAWFLGSCSIISKMLDRAYLRKQMDFTLSYHW